MEPGTWNLGRGEGQSVYMLHGKSWHVSLLLDTHSLLLTSDPLQEYRGWEKPGLQQQLQELIWMSGCAVDWGPQV